MAWFHQNSWGELMMHHLMKYEVTQCSTPLLFTWALFAESVSHATLFFSHNKSANSIFNHCLSAKRTAMSPLTSEHTQKQGKIIKWWAEKGVHQFQVGLCLCFIPFLQDVFSEDVRISFAAEWLLLNLDLISVARHQSRSRGDAGRDFLYSFCCANNMHPNGGSNGRRWCLFSSFVLW
jgi:hypothetical protein